MDKLCFVDWAKLKTRVEREPRQTIGFNVPRTPPTYVLEVWYEKAWIPAPYPHGFLTFGEALTRSKKQDLQNLNTRIRHSYNEEE